MKGHDMSDQVTFREKVRAAEALVNIATPDPDRQIEIISVAQSEAAKSEGAATKNVIEILAIAKRRIIRRAEKVTK
jgi:hypothetical protein